MKQIIRIILTSSPILAVILAVFQLVISNQSAGSGKTIRTVDISIDSVRSQNEILEEKVASASSLLTIESRAKELGFVEPKTSQYLTIAPDRLPVAFNPKQ